MLCIAWHILMMVLAMEFIKIVFATVVASIVYGILHDQVTARVCVEYFTIGHPPIFRTEDPTVLAIGWGLVSTWWVGVLLGLPLAVTARVGSRPKLSVRDILRPLLVSMVCVGLLALLAGVFGFFATQRHLISLGRLGERVPQDRHPVFMADAWAHSLAYTGGFLAGVALLTWVWKERKRRAARTRSEAVTQGGK
jgi:hypothetical protein